MTKSRTDPFSEVLREMSRRKKALVLASLTFALFVSFYIIGTWIGGSTEESAAIRVAKKEARKHGWTICLVGQVLFENGKWEVYLDRFPWELGGHCIVIVSTNGQVLNYYGGK